MGRPIALLVILATLRPAPLHASPNVPLDDPLYVELARLRALGRIPLYLSGVRPLTEARVQQLLLRGGESPSPRLLLPSVTGLWVAPIRRLTTRLILANDELSPYATSPGSPMAGGVEISCEHQEGRACGSGAGLVGELDSAAGYGKWVSLFGRFNLISGTDEYGLSAHVERLYLDGELGPVALEAGRDVLAIGPGAHTQLIWGDHAPPLDHARIATSHPIKIPRVPIALSALYALGRLREPQTFHNTLVTIARLQADLFDQLEVGATQLLQLGGTGAPHLSFGDFLEENFTRSRPEPPASNRRDAIDITYTVRRARGMRIYYEIAFEDFRKELVDMFAYDCDHLLGVELPVLTADGRHGLVLEIQHNGPFSQTHSEWLTGMTNAGRAVGAPLGPDSWSLYAAGRIDLSLGALVPAAEFAQRSSDQFQADHTGVYRTRIGIDETRLRLGARAWLRLREHLRAQLRAQYEHVWSADFVPGAERNNLVLETALVWEPEIPSR
jgi:hypothetical protein